MKSFVLALLVASVLGAPTQQPSCTQEAAAAPAADCAQVQGQLEKGIQANLDIQAQELKGVEALQGLLSCGSAGGNATGSASNSFAFQAAQKEVLNIQAQGITIRAENQKLAGEISSPAADGLAVVAQAQVLEMSQVQSLKGTAADEATLQKLVQEVMDGTMQNQKNLAAAKGQACAK
ncbi:hypothetical protein FB567DRAFT_231124 [Paraphoma chrysanthemicola]|uniref:Uncharacterized protein n=1 Tax=Paraphoma chrysanthemicola TaxID=798071 RepID=A0A8K0RE32_9PLEO|nr:hypothetical protein FB567DRAFT_231124 [Paraphoma chrysanthemicola]